MSYLDGVLTGIGIGVTAFGFVALIIGIWVRAAGDGESDMLDEPPTLDVQNHVGDEVHL